MRRALTAAALVAAALLPTARIDAAPAPGDEVELVLLEQDFAVTANGRWQATFELQGDVGELPLTTTTTTTPATSTTAASSADPAAPSTEIAGETTTQTTARADRALAQELGEVWVVAYLPIADRDSLTEFIDGDDRNVIDALPLAPSVHESGGRTELRVDAPTTVQPSAPGALHLRRPGLYPIAVQLRVDGEVVAEHRTFLERRPFEASSAAPIDIAVLAAVSAPPPDAADELSDEQRLELEDLAAVADRFTGPLTIALPPGTMSGVAAEAPSLAETLHEVLAGDELLALPAMPLDPSSAVAIDRADTFARRLRDGEDTIAATMPGQPPVRSAWIAPDAVSTDAATMLRDLGFDLMVLDAATYGQLDGNIGGFFDATLAVDLDLGAGGTMPAVVANPFGELLEPGQAEQIGPADAAVQLLARLVTTRRELGEDQHRGVVLATTDGELPDSRVLGALAQMAGDLDDVRLVPASALSAMDTMVVDGTRSTVTLPDEAGPDLAARLERIELTRLAAESSASMLVDDTMADAWRAQLDALVNTALTDDQVDAALSEITTEAEAIRNSVEPPQPFDFTLTGRSSTLRLNVRNNSDQTLQVLVRARSPKLTFPGGDQLVELSPAGSTEVVIPVEARSNGTSSIEVELLTPAFEQRIDGPVVLTANVNALTGLGQVITVGALLVLVSWWFSHFRRQRRARSLAAASAASAAALDEISPDAAEAAAAPGGQFDDELEASPMGDLGRQP